MDSKKGLNAEKSSIYKHLRRFMLPKIRALLWLSVVQSQGRTSASQVASR